MPETASAPAAPDGHSAHHPPANQLALAVGSIGVVYGDIGTSPLYAFREALSAAVGHGPVTPEAVAAMRPQMRLIMKQVQGTIKSSFESGVVFIQTHENIVVNQRLSAADFVR